MNIVIKPSNGSGSTVQFGPVLRSDNESRWELFKLVIPDDPATKPSMESQQAGKMNKKGRLRFALDEGEKYMFMAQGNWKAGLAHTARQIMTAPFHLSIDAPPSERALKEREAKARAMQEQHRPNVLTRAIRYVLSARGR